MALYCLGRAQRGQCSRRGARGASRWELDPHCADPIVPIVDVGLWPVVQMTVLSVITVWLARARPPRRLASDPPVASRDLYGPTPATTASFAASVFTTD